MALAQPGLILATRSQSLTTVITLGTYTSIAGWTVAAILRAYHGGPALATGTTTPTDTGTVASWSIAWSATDLALEPGGYVYDFVRTNAGYEYPIIDSSAFVLRPNGAGSYPTLTNLSEYLAHALPDASISDSQAKQLTQLLFAAEARIQKYCGRDFVYRATQTEYYDGHGTTLLRLRRTPVVCASVAIREDWNGNYGQTAGSFPAETALTLGTDYAIAPDSWQGDALNHSGLVHRINTTWPCRSRRERSYLTRQREPLAGCLQVTYSAGYPLIPYDLKRCVWDLATMYSVGATWGGVATSESGEGYSRGLGSGDPTSDLPMHIRAVLNQYRDGGSYAG